MKRLIHDRDGAAAVEFALIAPLMLLMYFGMAEVTQGLLANRRASHVTAVVGDLVAQTTGSLTEDDVDDVFTIGTALMAPMPAGTLTIRVTSIAIDKDKVATVRWSRAHGPSSTLTAFGDKATLTDVPPDLLVADEALVRADTEYVYTSPAGKVIPEALTFKHTIHLKPRSNTPVPLED